MTDLLKRLQSATGADRKLDWEILSHVGWTDDRQFVGYGHGWVLFFKNSKGEHRTEAPEVSASLDAAIALVEEVLEHKSPSIQLQIGKLLSFATIAAFTEANWAKSDHNGKHKSPAIALLIALLRALETGGESDG